ncbi:MAG: ABC-2 family transporter protein [Anaerolineaceae bacterium]|nr:ABC-2 family transporter protein [Anaerolineaceae bacterium]
MKVMGGNPMLFSSRIKDAKVFVALLKFYSKLSVAYKTDLALRWLGYPARLLITYLLWSYLLRVNHVSKEQTNSVIIYFIFALFFSHLYSFIRMSRDIREEIYGGDIVLYMVRPLSHLAMCLTKAIMTIVLNTLFALPILVIVGFVITGYFPSISQMLMLLITFFLGFVMTFMIYYIIGLTSFFTDEIIGTLRLFMILSEFFGGVYLPLNYFPPFFQKILYYSPFQFWVYLPASMISGNIAIESAFPLLVIGIGWILLLAVLIRVIWHFGSSRYSGHSV